MQVAGVAASLTSLALLGCSAHRVAAGAATVGYEVLEEENCAPPGEAGAVKSGCSGKVGITLRVIQTEGLS